MRRSIIWGFIVVMSLAILTTYFTNVMAEAMKNIEEIAEAEETEIAEPETETESEIEEENSSPIVSLTLQEVSGTEIIEGKEVVAYTMWATSSLNVRSGAGTEYDIIGYYSYGDQVSVISRGTNGWSKILYNETTGYVSSSVLSETEPTPKKSYNGIYEGDVITGSLTYYCSCSKCCGKSDGITASGVKAYDGVVACNWLPLGTIITINGVQYTVADRGGSSLSTVGRIDVYTSAGHQAALNLGTASATVVIVSLP